MSTADNFVTLTRSPAALQAALGIPALRETAAGNQALPEDLWLTQYPATPKPSVKLAKLLVERSLSSSQLDHVIATEARPAVLTKAFKATRPTSEQLHALLDSKALTANLANEIVESFADLVDVDWLRTAAAKVGQKARMEYFLRAPDELSDTEVIAALEDYDTWCADWDTDRQHKLLASRPSVLPGAVRSNSLKLRTSAAGCRFLTDPDMQRQLADLDAPEARDPETAPKAWLDERSFVWVALVCNPTCDLKVVAELDPLMMKLGEYESRYRASNRLARQPFRVAGPFEDVTDTAVISWLLRRTLPGQSKDGGRLYDLPAVLGNKHLSEGEAHEVLLTLSDKPRAVSAPGVEGPLRALIDRFPAVAKACSLTQEDLTALLAEEVTRCEEGRAGHEAESGVDLFGPFSAEEVEKASTFELRTVGWDHEKFARAVEYLDRELTDAVPSYLVLFRLLDQGSFAGTVADLATVVNATA